MGPSFSSSVIGGVIDNRQKDRVRGLVWIAGDAQPIRFDLEGNAAPDLAGRRCFFFQPEAQGEEPSTLATSQTGMCGEIGTLEDEDESDATDAVITLSGLEHFERSLRLEWLNQERQRIVIEADFQMCLTPRVWSMTECDAQGVAKSASRIIEAAPEPFYPQSSDRSNDIEEYSEDAPPPEPETMTAREVKLIDRILDVITLRRIVWKRDVPPAISWDGDESNLIAEQRTLRNLARLENENEDSLRITLLARDGYRLPADIDSLTDNEAAEEVFYLAYHLAFRRLFLTYTNHLTDHQLLEILTHRVLRQHCSDTDWTAEWNTTVSVAELPSPTGDSPQTIFLRYYADSADLPFLMGPSDAFVPEPVEPPSQRDAVLPRHP